MFVPAWLCEFGLDDSHFRIYARIARREGEDGAYESVRNMAIGCRKGERQVQRIVGHLLEWGLVTAIERKGKTTVYRTVPGENVPSPPSQMSPPADMTPPSRMSPHKASNPVSNVTPPPSDMSPPPPSDMSPEGNPLKGIHIREERSDELFLAFGGPPPREALPITKIIRDSEIGQCWIDGLGREWHRAPEFNSIECKGVPRRPQL